MTGGAPAGGAAPRFSKGEAVRVRPDNPAGHTRAPAYVRGRVGVVESVRAAAKLPDSAVHEPTPRRERVYAVRFDMPALWGASAEAGSELVLELWESYLEPGGRPDDASPGRIADRNHA